MVDTQHVVRRVTGRPPARSATLLQLLATGATAESGEVFLPPSAQWIALAATRQPAGWVIYGQDITRRSNASSSTRPWPKTPPTCSPAGAPTCANAAFATQAGAPLPQLLGRTCAEMAAPAEASGPYMAALQRVFATGQPQEHYDSFATPHGPAHYYSRLVPELRDGQVETVLGIARDITALKHTEAEALRLQGALAQRTTDKYHALFYSMDQGFCVLEVLFDDAGEQALDVRYLELNPLYERESGMPAEVGRTACFAPTARWAGRFRAPCRC